MEDRQSTAADVANAYRVLLGRVAENEEVCAEQSGPGVVRLIEIFWSSGEFAEAVADTLRDGVGGGNRFERAPLPRDARWIADTFPIEQRSREALASIRTWSDLYHLLLTDARFSVAIEAMSLGWRREDLIADLPRWSRAFPASARAGRLEEAPEGDGANRDAIAPLPGNFDPEVYARYSDTRESRLSLADHYCKIGFRQGRVYNRATYNHRNALLHGRIDEELYRAQRPRIGDDSTIVDDWIFHGSISGLQPTHDFSQEYYGRRYSDLVNLNIDLFEHFVSHGRAEGRLGRFVVDDLLRDGGKPWDLLAPTIILVSHEASRTGAPILALALIREFTKTHNVLLLMPRGGELMDEFAAACMMHGVGDFDTRDGVALIKTLRERYCVEGIVINSVVSHYMAEPSLLSDLPSVGLIHEFASYTKPAMLMTRMIEQLDVAITPAKLIAEQINAETSLYRGGPTANLVIMPQGFIPPISTRPSIRDLTVEMIRNALNIAPGDNPAIVLGGGTVQMRKGVDLFVQTAAEVKRKSKRSVKFVWAGHGYDPEADTAYSMYLEYMIAALDLKQDILIAPPQEQFCVMTAMADVFFVSSRQDPFPNVAVDAFAADKPVVCFEHATGIAEAIPHYGFGGGVAPYCDVHAAAELINLCIENGSLGGRNQAIVKREFRIDNYAVAVLDQLQNAKQIVKQRQDMVEDVLRTGCFDPAFHEGQSIEADQVRDAVRRYVARAQKGLTYRNPRIGFSEGFVRTNNASGRPGLLIAAEIGDECPTTHRTINVDDVTDPRFSPILRVAIHLHLHYADLANEFLNLCLAAEVKADVFISTTSERGRIECEHAFRDYAAGRVCVARVENRGRDISPMVIDFPNHFNPNDYDVLGHFHGKRTVGAPELGKRWRRFLLDTLIGGAPTYRKVLTLFADEPRLGMVFAEDSHSVGWNQNLPCARELAKRLDPQPVIPAYPIFPLGTMFWARPRALASIWDGKAALADLPGEPLASDGTILHAFERLLPSIVESNNFEWATLHRPGKGW